MAKPPTYSLSQGGDLSTRAEGTGLLTEEAQQAPVLLLMTEARTEAFKPSACPNNIASATTIC